MPSRKAPTKLPTVCFLDNDIILKLSAFDLLGITLAALGFHTSKCSVLDTAKHALKGRRFRSQYPENVINRAVEFAEKATSIRESPDRAELTLLLSIPQIDLGEALLIAATKKVTEFVLLTGDKKCLRALAASSKLKPTFDRLSGRVLSLEEIIKGLIDRVGFDRVKKAIIPALTCDRAIAYAFADGKDTTEDAVKKALDEQVANLDKELGGGWLMKWPC